MPGSLSRADPGMTRHAYLLTLLCVHSALANPDPVSLLQSLEQVVPTEPVVVSGRQLTRTLIAEGLTAELRSRLLEFMESEPSTWVLDPVTKERVDALRRVRFTRHGHLLQYDSVVMYVFTNDGQPRKHTIIWTDANRFEQIVQNNPVIDRQTIQPSTLDVFTDQIGRGIQPWDLRRSHDGGYFECVSIALSLLSQASDIAIDTTGMVQSLGSETAQIRLYFDPNTLAVSEVWLPNPGQQGKTIHIFGGRLTSSSIGHHPEYWLIERVNGSERSTIQTIIFDSARKASNSEIQNSFRWDLIGDRVRDKVSGVVYKKDGSVDQAATDFSIKITQSEPVPFFDVMQTDAGTVIKAHRPKGVSARVAVTALGIGLAFIGGIAAVRSRSSR